MHIVIKCHSYRGKILEGLISRFWIDFTGVLLYSPKIFVPTFPKTFRKFSTIRYYLGRARWWLTHLWGIPLQHPHHGHSMMYIHHIHQCPHGGIQECCILYHCNQDHLAICYHCLGQSGHTDIVLYLWRSINGIVSLINSWQNTGYSESNPTFQHWSEHYQKVIKGLSTIIGDKVFAEQLWWNLRHSRFT